MSASYTRARRIRIAGWIGFAVIALVGEAIQVAGLSPNWRQAGIDAVTYLFPIALGLGASIVLVRRTSGLEREVWGLVAAASALLLCSETYVSLYIDFVDWRGPRLPAPFELLQAAAAIAFLAILWRLTAFGETSLAVRTRIVVDIHCAVVVGMAATYWWVMLPLYGHLPAGGWQAAAVTSIYPICGTFLVAGGAYLFFAGRRYHARSWERLFASAVGLFGVGLCYEPFWYAQALTSPYPESGGVLSVFFGFGYYLLFMAMLYRLTAPAEETGLDRWPMVRLRPSWLAASYPSLLALALPFMAWASLVVGHWPAGRFIVALTVALVVGLVLRTWLSDIERARLRDMVILDPVSGAFNFRYLHERLSDELAEAAIGGTQPSLVVFDIDEFSRINSIWGHEAGDDVLRRVAELITRHVEPNVSIYRVGGDEFAAFVRATVEDAVLFAKRAQARVRLTEILPQTTITLSAGLAVYPRHGTETETLLAHAQAALQIARLAESDAPVVYDDEVVGSVDPVERLARAQRRAHRATVRTLARAVDARDPDTKNHSENVAELATSLATVLGLPTDQIRIVRMAAEMHDVGKIGIRDSVLRKADETLTAEERRHVEEHPVLGERILAPAQLDAVLPAVRHHHERWDGSGYPDGLRGPQIPVSARILAVCDSFEAMTSTRVFREAMPLADALREVESRGGSQFDPEVAATFVRMVSHLRSPVATDGV